MDANILSTLQTSVRKDIYDIVNNEKVGMTTMENGEIITKLLKIPNYVYANFTNSVTFIIPFFFGILFFTMYMFYINWRIGTVSLVYFTLFFTFYVYYYLKLCNQSNIRYANEGVVMNHFEDVLMNHENILLHNSRNYEKDRLFKVEKQLQDSQNAELNAINDFKMIFVFLLGIFMFGIIIYCSFLCIQGKVDLYKLVILTTAVLLMTRSFTNLIRRCSDSISEFGPTLKDTKFLEDIDQSHIHYGKQKKFFRDYQLELRNVRYSVGDKEIIKGVSITIPFKEKILIMGEIGSGKTTLIRMICGYFHASSGKILFDNVDIKDTDISYLRDYITMMHQNIKLFKRPVLENIFYGISTDSEIWISLCKRFEKMEVYSFVNKFIHIEDATKLSGGQKQIVLLLRCFFKNSKIIILDEPTANVDTETRAIIIKIIQEMQKNSTVITISHDIYLRKYFDKLYILRNGRLYLEKEE
jgi:ABC-type bacteriocin/lantibiotic exporter with double-glycine peptidase domain